MIAVMMKEIHEFLYSIIAYLIIGVFLIGVSIVLWVLPKTSLLEYGYASMEPLFNIGPYLFMFLIPAITMKSFAEEKRSGTIELLYTLPLSSRAIVLGKFLAASSLVFFSLLPTLVYYYSIYQLGNPPGNLDTSGIVGAYFGLFFLGSVFASIGIFSSSITENQIVSFVVAATLCYISYEGFTTVARIDLWVSWAYYIEYFGIMFHYNAMSKGVIDLSNLTYFVGFIVIMLLATNYSLEARK
ncbi:MAG: gliding motility-associated ABC transporter permease subunit GldF [Flammeovirgaceae bacterium]|nr:gliding motility-associated ABC transporter permease subunit GldF [Flammeovirgaceae bacterium]|tara:strand:+ start:2345 stop:3070 length:726 start_codon:yes stop_codon:yes gene_type:complete